MRQCPSCASYNERGALFCNQCGATLHTASRRTPARGRRGVLAWISALAVLLSGLIAAVVYVAFFLPADEHVVTDRRVPARISPKRELVVLEPEAPEPAPSPEVAPGVVEPDDPGPLSLAEARSLLERALVVLQLTGRDGRPLREARGIIVDPEGVVLCRLGPLPGAYGGVCRLAGTSRAVPILGVVHHDLLLDAALVRVDARGVELDSLPLLPSRDALHRRGDPVYVLSGERVKASEVADAYFSTAMGVVGIRLAESPPLSRDTFVAVETDGQVLGLCRPLDGDRLVTEAADASARVDRILALPAGGFVPFLESRVVATLSELTARLFDGTFADLEERGRLAYREKRWAAAVDLLGQALAAGVREGLPEERLDRVVRELRESYLTEIPRLRDSGRLPESEQLTAAALQQFPEDATLWRFLGEIRLELGFAREAIAALVQLRSIEAGRQADRLLETAYLRLGADLREVGNDRAAEATYTEGLAALPNSALLYLELGGIYRTWEAYDDALAFLERARELDPALASRADLHIEKIEDVLRKRDAVVIPIEPGSSVIRAQAVIDGRGQFDFIVDTGATFTALPERAARSLGYDPEKGELVQVRTASGRSTVRAIHLSSLSIEGYTVRNLKTLILPDGIGPKEGLLGLNFLRFFKYGVDSRRNEFRLERP